MSITVTESLGAVYAQDEHVHVSWWDGPTNHATVQAFFEATQAFCVSTKGPRALVIVVPSDAPAPGSETRPAMARVVDNATGHGVTPTIIMLGRGFRASIHRSIATAVSMLATSGRGLIVADDLDQLVAKVPPAVAALRAQLKAAYDASERGAAARAAKRKSP